MINLDKLLQQQCNLGGKNGDLTVAAETIDYNEIIVQGESVKSDDWSEQYEKAKNNAFHLLGYRARTKQELVERLQNKEYAADVIQAVLATLERLQLLDDKSFAEQYISEHTTGKALGRMGISYRLRALGVPENIINEQLADCYPAQLEQSLALQTAVHYLGRQKSGCPDNAKLMQKAAAFLQRRGFSFEAINGAMHASEVKDILTEDE